MSSIKYIVIVILASIIIIYKNWTYIFHIVKFDNYIEKDYLLNNTNIHNKEKNVKKFQIVLWTKYFSSNEWSNLNLKDLKCKYSNCLLTSLRNNFQKSDAILFHWRDINVEDMPSLKLPHQKWVLFNMESPLYTPIESVHPLIDRIDWTMTYRSDSDIYSPYGRIEKCANNNSRPNYNFKHKKKNIAWIVSHCNTFSNRETYVKKLQQFIDIDIYGSCGNLSCIRNSLCYQMIENNYKFFLSFENSLCRDYVTEKLYKFIGYDIIPIVFGGADYASLLPTNSYIDVFNFSSPQHLAAFLNEIGSDQNKYNSYFNWKNYYCSVQTHWTYFCDLCKKLNSPSLLNYNNKTNFIDWWFREANCTSRSIS